MKKKIHPKDQTEELNKAKVEFIKRNEKEFNEFKELFEKDNKVRDQFLTELASLMGGRSQKYKDSWDLLLRDQIFDNGLKEKIAKNKTYPAANGLFPYMNFAMHNEHYVMAHGGRNLFQMSLTERDKKCLDYFCQNARPIFSELTNNKPSKHLLVGIDLTRNKETILAEIAELVTLHQLRTGIKENKKERLKWLPIVDEIIEVWDLYQQAGKQPARVTFKDTARITKRPLSTVKDQWRKAYEMIYGIPYEPELKYATEEKRADGEKLVCVQCPHLTTKGAKCQRDGEFYPCAEYLKIVGKEKKVTLTELHDNILYDN